MALDSVHSKYMQETVEKMATLCAFSVIAKLCKRYFVCYNGF